MNVLYVAHYFLPNMAAGVTTKEIIKMLLLKGHKVTLIAASTYMVDNLGLRYDRNELRLRSAFTAVPTQLARKSKLAAMLVSTLGYVSVFIVGLRTLKRDGPFDVVIAQHHPFHLSSLTSHFLSTLARTSFIIKVHDIMPSSPAKNMLESVYDTVLTILAKTAFAHADCVLCPSTEMAGMVTELGLKESEIVVFPNTVDLRLFSASQCAAQLRDNLKLVEKKIVLFMATDFEGRGLDVLLKALRIVEDERVTLVVVGPCDEKYVELARHLRVDHRVVFTGQVDHDLVPAYIHIADVCVGQLLATPYTYGVVTRKVIEYMACGKPVIVARGASTKDLIMNGRAMVLVGSGKENEVAQSLTLLTRNKGLSEMIGKQARKAISERYSTEKLANTLDTMLRKLSA